MAERRMFSKTLVDSDAFLDLPLSAQALYFHLCMRADDDGFANNPKKLQRMTGCGADDLEALVREGFIIPFESGVCAVRHWRMHNYIRNDRYKPTVYQAEKRMLDRREDGGDPGGIPVGGPAADQAEPQVREEKARLEPGEDTPPLLSPQGERDGSLAAGGAGPEDGFEEFWRAYPKKTGKGAARKCWERLQPDRLLAEKIAAAVERCGKTEQWRRDNGRYIPNPATWLGQERWEDEPEAEAGRRKPSYDIDELEDLAFFDLPDDL